jgi:hypothetical protein
MICQGDDANFCEILRKCAGAMPAIFAACRHKIQHIAQIPK